MTVTPQTAAIWARLPMGNLTGMRVSAKVRSFILLSLPVVFGLSGIFQAILVSAAAGCSRGSIFHQQTESIHDSTLRTPRGALFCVSRRAHTGDHFKRNTNVSLEH